MSERPVVFVTGASGGIGAATSLEFARRGYDVALAARSADRLEQVAAAVRDCGARAVVLPGDLADLEYAERAVAETIEQLGHVDTLVNNAAWREIVTMRTISVESWEKTLRVSLTAPAFLARWVAADMEQRGRGVIVNVSSIQSQAAAGISPAYIACKGALDALTYELATLWGPKGIRVVAVNPGAVETDMSGDYESSDGGNLSAEQHRWSEDLIPLRRWASSDEIAKTIAMLASDDASYITGATIFTDGGLTKQLSPYSLKARMFPEEFE